MDPEVTRAWSAQFVELPDVEVRSADILEVEAGALLLPGNSFGFLDSGLELQVVERFGFEVQDRLRQRIRRDFAGELLVGQAIPLELPSLPWRVAYAPIWRTPGSLEGTVNVHLALRGAMLALEAAARAAAPEGSSDSQGPPLVLACPALGCGPPGELHPAISARQLRYAYEVCAGHRGLGDKNLSQLARRQKKLQSLPGSVLRESSEGGDSGIVSSP
jgi:O-acetyl-ADP-ribose deacetylase (regulator of RNase III)